MLDQRMRPAPFKRPMMPTMEAAWAASMPATSWAMGEATAKRPMPQVIFTKKIHQRAVNCQVFMASPAVRPCWSCLT